MSQVFSIANWRIWSSETRREIHAGLTDQVIRSYALGSNGARGDACRVLLDINISLGVITTEDWTRSRMTLPLLMPGRMIENLCLGQQLGTESSNVARENRGTAYTLGLGVQSVAQVAKVDQYPRPH